MEFAEIEKKQHNLECTGNEKMSSLQFRESRSLQRKIMNDSLKISQGISSGEVRFCQHKREAVENQTINIVQKMKWIWNGKEWIPMYPTAEEPPKIRGDVRGAVCIIGDYNPESAKPYSPKFNTEDFALYKLLGKFQQDDASYPERKSLLKNASKACIYLNSPIDINTVTHGAKLLTSNNDFPGMVYESNRVLYITNIHGMGRAKEAESYLQCLTLARIEIISGDKTDEDIIESRLGTDTIDTLKGISSIHLIIMPLSTLGTINKRRYDITWRQVEYQHEWIKCYETNKIYFVADIKWANGSLVTALINVLCKYCNILSTDLYGTAGSLNSEIKPGMLVAPEGPFCSIDPEYREEAQEIGNQAASIRGLTVTRGHGNVSSILDEDDLGVRELIYDNIDTIDMEGYHLVRKLNEMKREGKEIPLRMIFRIYDLITSEESNITKPPVYNEETLRKKKEIDKRILHAFGLQTYDF